MKYNNIKISCIMPGKWGGAGISRTFSFDSEGNICDLYKKIIQASIDSTPDKDIKEVLRGFMRKSILPVYIEYNNSERLSDQNIIKRFKSFDDILKYFKINDTSKNSINGKLKFSWF